MRWTRPQLTVAAWAGAYTTVRVAWAATGATVPLTPRIAWPPAAHLALAGVALLSAGACLAGTKARGAKDSRMSGRAVQAATTGVLTVSVLVFGAGAVSLPLHLVTLLSGAGVESATGLAQVLLDAAGAALLAHCRIERRRRVRGVCVRCGQGHRHAGGGPLVHPAPSTATRRTRAAVFLLMCGVLPWAGVKTVWTLGGDALGVTARRWREANAGAPGTARALASVGIDVTVLAAMLAIFLMLGLMYRWGVVFPRWTVVPAGRRVPRLLPLVPAWLVGAGLGAYGIALTGYAALAALGMLPAAEPSGGFTVAGLTWMIAFGGLAFAGLGLGLLVAARSYASRTRPVCGGRV
ncbi:hypothetical protein ACGF0J_19545 [Nonomuraea sp. NPDC047897]|uniref:hypothetical protein n=1 Tax=Nonomuraea sp. NPDC047897 TaxID=3364346 RepID=UPI00371589F4